MKLLNIPLGGGVNLFDDPTAIPDGQWQRAKNIATRKTGVVGSRQSMSFSREVIPHWKCWDIRLYTGTADMPSPAVNYHLWAQYLRPLQFLFEPNYGEITMVAITTGGIQAGNTMAVYDRLTGAVVNVPEGTVIAFTLPCQISNLGAQSVLSGAVLGSDASHISMFVFNGTTYIFAGGNNGCHNGPGAGGIAVDPVAFVPNDFGSGNNAFAPQGACVVRNRVVYYSGSNLYFSDPNAPLTVGYTGSFDANGILVPSTANPPLGTNYSARDTRGIFLGGEELEPITAVAEVNTSADGSPIQSVAMAFTSRHAYMLLGEPLSTTDGGNILGSLQINRLNVQAGCISQQTITRTPYGTFWVGADDVWFMPFGSLPIRVGTAIRPLLEAQPPGLLWKIHAEYDNGFYRISLFADGQGPTQYDPCAAQIWLDLRRGAPKSAEDAQWFGPHIFVNTDGGATGHGTSTGGVYCMARDTRATGDGKLYALQKFVCWGSDYDSYHGMSLCSFDKQDGRDTTAPQGFVQKWVAASGYYEGDTFTPTPSNLYSGWVAPVWVCTTSGVSHASIEPSWLANTGTGTITDGTVVWKLKFWDGTHPLTAYDVNVFQGANQHTWALLSKEYTMGDPMLDKLLDSSELGYWASDRTSLQHNLHEDQDTRTHTLGMANQQTADNVADQTTGGRVWQSAQLTQSPNKRFQGKTATWECAQQAGIVITLGVNDTIQVGASSGALRTYTVPAGYYADLRALADAITVAAAADPLFPDYLTFTIQSAWDGLYHRPLIGIYYRDNSTTTWVGTGTRLVQLFGFSPNQGATVSAATPGDFAFGYESPRIAYAPEMQLSGINLKYKMFNRRPT